jgi:hypothetical protein
MPAVEFKIEGKNVIAEITFAIGRGEFAEATLLDTSHWALIQTLNSIWKNDWFDFDQYLAKRKAEQDAE